MTKKIGVVGSMINTSDYLLFKAFYFYLSTKIIMVFITKSYQDLFGVRSYINAKKCLHIEKRLSPSVERRIKTKKLTGDNHQNFN